MYFIFNSCDYVYVCVFACVCECLCTCMCVCVLCVCVCVCAGEFVFVNQYVDASQTITGTSLVAVENSSPVGVSHTTTTQKTERTVSDRQVELSISHLLPRLLKLPLLTAYNATTFCSYVLR